LIADWQNPIVRRSEIAVWARQTATSRVDVNNK